MKHKYFFISAMTTWSLDIKPKNSTTYLVMCWPSSFCVQKLVPVIQGTAPSFVILSSRCWQPAPEGKIWGCHSAHVPVPLPAPDSRWGDGNTEILCVYVCTRIEKSNCSSFASALLRDIILNSYISYESLQVWYPCKQYHWIGFLNLRTIVTFFFAYLLFASCFFVCFV